MEELECLKTMMVKEKMAKEPHEDQVHESEDWKTEKD